MTCGQNDRQVNITERNRREFWLDLISEHSETVHNSLVTKTCFTEQFRCHPSNKPDTLCQRKDITRDQRHVIGTTHDTEDVISSCWKGGGVWLREGSTLKGGPAQWGYGRKGGGSSTTTTCATPIGHTHLLHKWQTDNGDLQLWRFLHHMFEDIKCNVTFTTDTSVKERLATTQQNIQYFQTRDWGAIVWSQDKAPSKTHFSLVKFFVQTTEPKKKYIWNNLKCFIQNFASDYKNALNFENRSELCISAQAWWTLDANSFFCFSLHKAL